MPVYVGERELGNIMQQWLAQVEEAEELPADLFKEIDSELLFELFGLLTLGGKQNQWDQSVAPYRETIKKVYKNVVKYVQKHQKRRGF
jgi:hypothetical protein